MENIQTTSQPTDAFTNLENKMFTTSPFIFPALALIGLLLPCFCFCLCYARCWTRNKIPQTPKTPKQIA